MRIIGGEARGRRLLSPPDRSTRPPLDKIRESIFSLLEGSFEGRAVLDLYAGTGSLGLEALSRGARRALFVESAPACLSVLERNLRQTGFAGRAAILRASAVDVPDLSCIEKPGFAVVFLDPPFRALRDPETARPILDRVREILGSAALEPEGTVILRCPTKTLRSVSFPGAKTRRYGTSVVVFLTKPQPGT